MDIKHNITPFQKVDFNFIVPDSNFDAIFDVSAEIIKQISYQISFKKEQIISYVLLNAYGLKIEEAKIRVTKLEFEDKPCYEEYMLDFDINQKDNKFIASFEINFPINLHDEKTMGNYIKAALTYKTVIELPDELK